MVHEVFARLGQPYMIGTPMGGNLFLSKNISQISMEYDVSVLEYSGERPNFLIEVR